jgi:hypothetical protein
MTTTIELVSYKLKSGITTAQLQNTHDSLNSFCSQQEGFIYRSISKDQDNTWFDIVYWQNMECAQKAGEKFMQDEICHTLSELIDENTLVMRHMLADSEMLNSTQVN